LHKQREGLFKAGDNVSYTDHLNHFRGVGKIMKMGFVGYDGKMVRILDVWGYETNCLSSTLRKNEKLEDPRGKRP